MHKIIINAIIKCDIVASSRWQKQQYSQSFCLWLVDKIFLKAEAHFYVEDAALRLVINEKKNY